MCKRFVKYRSQISPYQKARTRENGHARASARTMGKFVIELSCSRLNFCLSQECHRETKVTGVWKTSQLCTSNSIGHIKGGKW